MLLGSEYRAGTADAQQASELFTLQDTGLPSYAVERGLLLYGKCSSFEQT